MSRVSEYQKHEIRRRISVEVVAEMMGQPSAAIDAEIDRRCQRQIANMSRTSWGPATAEERDASINAMTAAMAEALRPPRPPVAAYTPPAPRAEVPPLPKGIFRPPQGSRIRPDGQIELPGGGLASPCDSSGTRLHLGGKPEPVACPDWVYCRAEP